VALGEPAVDVLQRDAEQRRILLQLVGHQLVQRLHDKPSLLIPPHAVTGKAPAYLGVDPRIREPVQQGELAAGLETGPSELDQSLREY
jgi:hypothetical protein